MLNFDVAAIECLKVEQGRCLIQTSNKPEMHLVEAEESAILAKAAQAGAVMKNVMTGETRLYVNMVELASYAPRFGADETSTIQFKSKNTVITPRGLALAL